MGGRLDRVGKQLQTVKGSIVAQKVFLFLCVGFYMMDFAATR